MTHKAEAEHPSTARSAEHQPAVLAYRGFDAAALLAGQQRAIEAWVAATQKFIDGIQELFKRQILLQTALLEQTFANAASFAQAAAANGEADAVARTAQTAMHKTIEALRDTIDTSCKCSMDAMAVFRDRMAGGPGSDSAVCEKERPAPTTAEVIAASEGTGEVRGSTTRKAASG